MPHYIGIDRIDPASLRLPIFTTDSLEAAAWYARERSDGNGEVWELDVDAKNTLELRNEHDVNRLLSILDGAGVSYEFTPSDGYRGWSLVVPEVSAHSGYDGENPLDVCYIPKVRQALVQSGYDSVASSDPLTNEEIEVLVLIKSPAQVKRKRVVLKSESMGESRRIIEAAIRFAVKLADGRIIAPAKAAAHVDVYAGLTPAEQAQVIGAGYIVQGEYVEGGDLSAGLAAGYSGVKYYGEAIDRDLSDLKRSLTSADRQRDEAADFMSPLLPEWAESHGVDLAGAQYAYELDRDKYEKFSRWALNRVQSGADEYSELPWTTMDFQRLVRNEWLVHFSDDAYRIFRNGFAYGVDPAQPQRLALSTNYNNRKVGPGFNFAFLAGDAARYGFGRYGLKYGKTAVMFRASGLKVWHHGDEEPQVIFKGSAAHDFAYIERNKYDGGDWAVGERPHGQPIFTGSFDEAVSWVEKNWDQYRKVLRPGRERSAPAKKRYYETASGEAISGIRPVAESLPRIDLTGSALAPESLGDIRRCYGAWIDRHGAVYPVGEWGDHGAVATKIRGAPTSSGRLLELGYMRVAGLRGEAVHVETRPYAFWDKIPRAQRTALGKIVSPDSRVILNGDEIAPDF